VPDGAYITNIAGTVITLNTALTGSNPTLIFAPMGSDAKEYTFSAPSPTSVELAYPTFAPSISHWGTSVIMDGGFDDDKSLVFTYGQRAPISIAAGATRSIFSIRVAPSVDNGLTSEFGGREVVNRMQLVLRSLGISARASGNFLVRAILNGTPATTQNWTDAIGGVGAQANSSLAQVADYSTRDIPIFGGEVVAGFFTSGTDALDLSLVRDLGNSINGGGSANVAEEIYPDGPDVLTIIATNLGSSTAEIQGRISWTEAQA
jgi:hypothetical protein